MITSCSRFVRYIGIDYSGAKTAEAGFNGLRFDQAGQGEDPQEVLPSTGRKNCWRRRGDLRILKASSDGSLARIGWLIVTLTVVMGCNNFHVSWRGAPVAWMFYVLVLRG